MTKSKMHYYLVNRKCLLENNAAKAHLRNQFETNEGKRSMTPEISKKLAID